jgi:WD40 repeat protein
VVWELATGRPLFSRKLQGSWSIKAASFEPDGRGAVVLIEYSDAICVCRIDFQSDDWRELFRPFQPPFTVGEHLEVSPDRRTAVVSDYHHTLVCWDLVARKERWRLPKAGAIFAFSPDSKTLIINPTRGDARAHGLRDVATGELLFDNRLPPTSSGMMEDAGVISFPLRFTPDGRTVIFHARDKGLVLWDRVEGVERLKIPAGFITNRRSAITADGRTLFTLGKTLQRWNLTTGAPLFSDCEPWGHTASADRIEFSADGRELLSVSTDGTARIWDTTTANLKTVFRGHQENQVSAGAFLPDLKHVVTAGNDGYLRVWATDTGKELRSYSYHDPKVDRYAPMAQHLVLAADGRTAIALSSVELKYRLTRWDLRTGKAAESKLVDWLIPSPAGNLAYRFVGGVAGEFRLTDLDSGQVVRSLKYGEYPWLYDPSSREAVAFSRDGRLFAARVHHVRNDKGLESFFHIWETICDAPLTRIGLKADQFVPLAFSREGRLFAFADADWLRVWDLAAGREIWRTPQTVRTAVSIAFAPDGRKLAAGYDDTTILIWKLPPPDKGGPIAESERQSLWNALVDPTKAHAAMWRLIDDPDSAPSIIRRRLLPKPEAPEIVRGYLKNLGSEDFRTRDAADRQLRELGRAADAEIRKAVVTEQRLEARRRLTAILAALDAENLRETRLVTVLERVRTPGARQLLEELAKGAESARLTRESKTALERLGQ